MALTPAARAWAVLGKGLSPICNSMTSLPWALSLLATARTSKAVSAVRPRAKVLSVGGFMGDPEKGVAATRGGAFRRASRLHYEIVEGGGYCFAAMAWASGRTTAGIT